MSVLLVINEISQGSLPSLFPLIYAFKKLEKKMKPHVRQFADEMYNPADER